MQARDDFAVFVLPSADAWAVRTSAGGIEQFPDRQAALQAARRTCQYKWEYEGQPCRLRAFARDGRATAQECFGESWW
jgi:hypothetical protein